MHLLQWTMDRQSGILSGDWRCSCGMGDMLLFTERFILYLLCLFLSLPFKETSI